MFSSFYNKGTQDLEKLTNIPTVMGPLKGRIGRHLDSGLLPKSCYIPILLLNLVYFFYLICRHAKQPGVLSSSKDISYHDFGLGDLLVFSE